MDEFVGFRFHPTEEEIISYFLERKMRGLDFPVHTIAEVDVCKFEPWDLPQRSPLPPDDQVWYFFIAPLYKYARSKRTDRTTATGFWKVTGKDRTIWDKQGKKEIGFKKNLVFYGGRVPNGIKTDWVMHEYHSSNATSYHKEYVLCRLKRKSGDRSDTCNEANRQLASNPVNHVADAPQVNHDLSEDLRLLLDNNGLDRNSLSALVPMIQAEQGTSYHNGFGNERSRPNSHLDTTELDNAFANSLWADQDEFSGERSETLQMAINPSKSSRGVYVGDSGYANIERAYVLQGGNLFDENTNSKRYWNKPKAPASYETASSDGERFEAQSGFFDEIMDSDPTPEINCLELVVDEFPTNTRARKSQNTPKSHSFVEKKYAPQELHLQSKSLHRAVSKKATEAAVRAVDLPKTENSIVKFGADQKMWQTSNAKPSLKFRSNKGDSSNRKCSFNFLETTLIDQKNYPPSVYLGNVLVSVLLIIFFVREMVYLH